MKEERDECEEALANAISRVRGLVVREVQAGQRADVLSFALAFIATEIGLHMTHGRNALGVVGTALHGVIAATEAFKDDGRPNASSENSAVPAVGTDVRKGRVIH